MIRWMLACVLLVPSLALGQTVFFDDFNGNALLPHWNQPPPQHWQYNVGGGMLNVTGLFWPGIPPHVPTNSAWIASTLFPGLGDFSATARMGWDAGDGRELRFELASGALHVATFTYTELAGAPALMTPFGLLPGPPPGTYDFTVQRIGGELRFLLDGSPLGTAPATNEPLTNVGFFFVGPAAAPLSPLRVDRIQVVPSPGAASALVAGLMLLQLGRRRHAR